MSGLDKKLKEASEKLLKKQLPTTDVGMASGIARSGLQGLTFGFSDEIGAGVGATFDSVFSDQSFNDAFDKRSLKDKCSFPGSFLTFCICCCQEEAII